LPGPQKNILWKEGRQRGMEKKRKRRVDESKDEKNCGKKKRQERLYAIDHADVIKARKKKRHVEKTSREVQT